MRRKNNHTLAQEGGKKDADNINKYFNSRNYNENNSHLLFKKIDRYVEKMCGMTLKSNEKTVAILHKLQEGFELED